YAEIREAGLRSDRGTQEATEFYRQNREKMDEGARVAWPERHNHDELSALQHAINLKLRNELAFFAEYQPEPNITLGAQVGVSLLNNIELFDSAGNEIIDDDVDPGVFVGITGRIRF
ncbi:MAG: hypothetical protein AAGA55_09165, partial [Planctomycetota bacterium]